MTDPQAIILETPRLILRRLTLDDLDALAALYRDPVVRQYYPEGTLTRAETLEELEWIIDVYYGRYGYGLWATILKENGAFIGRCGLLPWTLEGRFEVEVAYMIAQEYWGRGLATEAARGIVDYAVAEWRFPRLICLIDKDNGASQAVARKIGMTFEREIDDGKGPAQMYAMQTGVTGDG